jgi:hypothetical protein
MARSKNQEAGRKQKQLAVGSRQLAGGKSRFRSRLLLNREFCDGK